MTDPKPVELTEAERDSLIVFDTGIYACAAEGYCSGYDHSQPGHDHEDIYDAVARIKAAARREALLEAAEHFTTRANAAHRDDLHVLSDAWDQAASDLRALAEPESDEEGGRDDTPLATPEQIEASRAFLAAQAEWDELRKQVRG